MKRVITFGNCQAGHLRTILAASLPTSEFEILNFSNNTRTGGKKSNDEIISAIRDCDVLIYQPLSRSHGELCEENIKEIIRRDCDAISFPYLFNSGICSLCHAPMAPIHSYGTIFGEDIIMSQIASGKSKQEIISDYIAGSINFNVLTRFRKSLAEMKSRELSTDIKLTGFIEQRYQDEKLFITHNHPANALFHEIIRQLKNILTLPINPAALNKLDLPQLPKTNCPTTPYDVKIHGYKFEADKDWITQGTLLIELVVNPLVSG